jgi:hypothetical protein
VIKSEGPPHEELAMSRDYTPFERSVIASLSWQIKGFREIQVPEDATRRILRASLRRVSPVRRGRSTQVTDETSTHIDHCVPVSVISDILLSAFDTSVPAITRILDRHLTAAELTTEEHRDKLREYQSSMPEGWDPDSTETDNDLARYAKVGIILAHDQEETDADSTSDSDRPASQSFPLTVFRPWAERSGLAVELREVYTDSSNLPAKCAKRLQTFRRGLAVELLEQENLLDSFLREEWPHGLTDTGRKEMERCKRFARRCREGARGEADLAAV